MSILPFLSYLAVIVKRKTLIPVCMFSTPMHYTIDLGNYAENSLRLNMNNIYCCSFNVFMGKLYHKNRRIISFLLQWTLLRIQQILKKILSKVRQQTIEDSLLQLSLLERNQLLNLFQDGNSQTFWSCNPLQTLKKLLRTSESFCLISQDGCRC